MTRHLYYDREGKRLSLHAWARLLEDFEYKVVRQTTVGPWWVSTVWLGLDHRYSGDGPPIIFETLVAWNDQADDDGLIDLDMMRYETEAQARSGHARFVRELRRRKRDLDATLERSGLPSLFPPADPACGGSNGGSNGGGNSDTP